MPFSEDEERILKLFVAELRTRKKLDFKNREVGSEVSISAKAIEAIHRAEIDPLKADLISAQQAIEEEFSGV